MQIEQTEWRRMRWGEIATLNYGKALRGYSEAPNQFRVYGTNGPIGWHGEALSSSATVVVGRKGAYRGVHYSPAPCYVIDTAFYLVPKTGFDMRWAYYQLLTQDINGMDSGSAIPSTSRDEFYQLSVGVPPIEEQRAIAHILGTLDDKIELNRRMNETLEEIARTLFTAWFVTFDPVRAKAEGRQPEGMEAETAALFPDSFVDSELGEIPAGWDVRQLADVLEINPTRSLRKGDETVYLDMANVPTSGPRAENWRLRPFNSGSRFRNGDVLLARITPCLENGKTCYVDFLPENETGWGSTEFIVLRSRPPLPEVWAYCLARDPSFREHAIRSMSGSSGRQRVPADAVSRYQVVVPPEEISEVFAQIVNPFFECIRLRDEESRTLAEIRDVLLPKLLSGEIGVRDLDGAVAYAAPVNN